jgi:hypothetical protein
MDRPRAIEPGREDPPDNGVLRMHWRRERQSFAFGDAVYSHEGRTKTNPSHDLSHLLIAANGGLPWLPFGESWRFAEYNAVFTETLLNHVYFAIVSRPVDGATILKRTLRHARWFVEKHYAPFPVPSEEAYRLYCWKIDPSVIGRLSPLFFELRALELLVPGGPEGGIVVQFVASDTPTTSVKVAEFAKQVREILDAIGGQRATTIGAH